MPGPARGHESSLSHGATRSRAGCGQSENMIMMMHDLGSESRGLSHFYRDSDPDRDGRVPLPRPQTRIGPSFGEVIAGPGKCYNHVQVYNKIYSRFPNIKELRAKNRHKIFLEERGPSLVSWLRSVVVMALILQSMKLTALIRVAILRL